MPIKNPALHGYEKQSASRGGGAAPASVSPPPDERPAVADYLKNSYYILYNCRTCVLATWNPNAELDDEMYNQFLNRKFSLTCH